MCKECKPFNMCLGEAYCVRCGKKEGYNINNPWTMPEKCKQCGGEMTTEQTEKLLKDLDERINESVKNKIKEIRKKNRTKEDQFVIDLLESLKENFINDNEYYGSAVKLIINGYIKRME